MISLYTFVTPPGTCSYLPDRVSRMEYEIVGLLSPSEYLERMKAGWRRFGYSIFRPACPSCKMCRSLRVPVQSFRPDRSQKRAWASNESEVRLIISRPAVSSEKLALYDRFHAFQTEAKGWPEHGPKDPTDYIDSFVDNPFEVEEWCYYLDGRLIGVGYVDCLAEGLSAIYFYYDPDERHRSLGTFNVQSVIRAAVNRGLPYVYLGFYVEGCRSLEYKGRFRPNEALNEDGSWGTFFT